MVLFLPLFFYLFFRLDWRFGENVHKDNTLIRIYQNKTKKNSEKIKVFQKGNDFA